MFDWLRFWRGRPPSSPKPVRPTDDPQPQSETNLVRGRAWADTASKRPPRAVPVGPPGMPGLIEDLRHRETTRRAAAAAGLGRLGAAAGPAVPALVAAAVDVEPAVRSAAVAALDAIDPQWPANVGPAGVETLVDALGSRFTEVWQQALWLVVRVGRPAVPALARAFAGPARDSAQVTFARALGRIGPDAADAVPALAAGLASEFAHVRREAADALSKLGPVIEAVAPRLSLCLGDRDIGTRDACLRALAQLGGAAAGALPAIVPLMADHNVGVRGAAVDALVGVGPAAVPALAAVVAERDHCRVRALLRREAERVTFRAAAVDRPFARDPVEEAWNVMWAFQEAVDTLTRAELVHTGALKALARLAAADAETVGAVASALADRAASVRALAAEALGRVGPAARPAADALVARLSDDNLAVRRAAAAALPLVHPAWAADDAAAGVFAELAEHLRSVGDRGRFAADTFRMLGAAAVPHLTAALACDDRVAREAAAGLLGELGPAAADAVPALTRALDDPHGWVRAAAAKALQQVAPPA